MTDDSGDRTGRCLCGSVTYRTHLPHQVVLHCHCENCRRISGNFVAASRAESVDLHVSDAAGRLSWYDLAYARYGFCQKCGSTLFYQASDNDHLTSVMTGTLDDASDLSLHEVWFAPEAQQHNTLSDKVPHFDGNA